MKSLASSDYSWREEGGGEPAARRCLAFLDKVGIEAAPLEPDPTDEMMAIAWSFAASKQCDISLTQLFHEGGYREDSASLRNAFATGQYIGAPMLGYYGMTADLHTAMAQGIESFPGMSRWLR